MNFSFRFKLMSAAMAFVLIFSMATPIVAFANEATPEEPTPGESTPPADEPAPEETPAAEETQETSEDEATEVNLAEVVETMAEAGVVLVDSDGEVIPLTSQEAASALVAPDPIGCPPGVTPLSWGGSGTGCTGSYTSIQAAIDDALVVAGWTIYIDPGTFYENVQVNKSVTLQGSGQGLTIVKPGATGTTDQTCGNPVGSCPNANNAIIWVLADGVKITDLTVDGNNNGEVAGGTAVDARLGIVAANQDNLIVEDVTVQNVYLRGIQASGGDNIQILNNTVDNVDGSTAAIAIFVHSSTGVVEGNTVSNANDGIAANWSNGVQFLNNTVSNSGTGIHTDNAQGADVISGNTITSGRTNSYGIFVFAPYEQITVSDNSITNVDIGLTLSGNGSGDPINEIAFDNNQVSANIAGAMVTTDVWWYFKSNVKAAFTNNTISGGQYGLYLESQSAADYVDPFYGASACTGDCILEVTLICNTITGGVFQATGLGFWNGDTTPNYNGTYVVDDSGNVCTVTPSPTTPTVDDEQGGTGDTSILPPPTGGGLFIPVTGGQTLSLNLDALSTTSLLQLLAAPTFPLVAENGFYSFSCILKSVTVLTPDQYIVQGDKTVTSVGQCSYMANGVERTMTIALTYLGEGGGFAPGDVLLVNLAEADFAGFAGSGNPFDAGNFMLASSLELLGATGTLDLTAGELLAALEGVAEPEFPLAENNGAYELACVLESVTVLNQGIELEDGQVATAIGVCSYLLDGGKQSVIVALNYAGGTDSFSPGEVLSLSLSGDAAVSFAGSGNPDDLGGIAQPDGVDVTGQLD